MWITLQPMKNSVLPYCHPDSECRPDL